MRRAPPNMTFKRGFAFAIFKTNRHQVICWSYCAGSWLLACYWTCLSYGTSLGPCFYFRHTGSLPIHGDASAKTALYRDRFLLLFQRLSRDQHFSKPAFHSEFSHFGSCEVMLDAPTGYKILIYKYYHMFRTVHVHSIHKFNLVLLRSINMQFFLYAVFVRYLLFNLWLGKQVEDG